MRFGFYLAAIFALAALMGCTPAAKPIAIGNKPISVNGVKTNEAREGTTLALGEMSWTGLNGGGVTKLKDLKGKAVVLDFWATNCPPCIEEIPHLIELKQKYGEELVLIGLHVGDDEDRAQVPAFVEKLKIIYPLGDPDTALTDFIFQTNSAIPQTAVFDRNGVMVRKIVGFNAEIRSQLDSAVERAVSSQLASTD